MPFKLNTAALNRGAAIALIAAVISCASCAYYNTFFFAKKYRRHSCSKRKRGNPKYGRGCCGQGRRWAVHARIRSRRLARDLTAGRVAYDFVEPPRGFYGEVERRRARDGQRAVPGRRGVE